MKRRYMPKNLDDTQFQVIRETCNGRRHLIVVPPAMPERSMTLRKKNIIGLEATRELPPEPWYNWLSYEAVISILEDTLFYPYVVIDGVRIENSYADEEMQRFVARFYANLEQLSDLCMQGHEDDKAYAKQVETLSELVADNYIGAENYMLEAGFRAGFRLGQKVQLEDLAENAQVW